MKTRSFRIMFIVVLSIILATALVAAMPTSAAPSQQSGTSIAYFTVQSPYGYEDKNCLFSNTCAASGFGNYSSGTVSYDANHEYVAWGYQGWGYNVTKYVAGLYVCTPMRCLWAPIGIISQQPGPAPTAIATPKPNPTPIPTRTRWNAPCNEYFVESMHQVCVVGSNASLSSIGAWLNINWQNIARWNAIPYPYTIYESQRLLIYNTR